MRLRSEEAPPVAANDWGEKTTDADVLIDFSLCRASLILLRAVGLFFCLALCLSSEPQLLIGKL
jgi:hypothetical protein